MTDRLQEMRKRLIATFTPLECQLEDESALHAGHAGAASGGGHYRIRLVSGLFEGQNRIARHRLVYDCLRGMMHSEIHALAIIALAPSEVSADTSADTSG
ncbi:MAG: BolA family transcriptional regulator [Herminiimonas sp.]|jgi:BolA protein|nr:BolA family transcriptional regulator [Herminiimonas sp.]